MDTVIDKGEDKYNIEMTYQFVRPEYVEVHEEYVIYDAIGMIGSVGGTLGMFIGFSFTNIISSIINYLKHVPNVMK